MYATLLVVALILAASSLPAIGLARGIDEDVDISEGDDLASWSFSPAVLTVQAGTTVTWHNDATKAHSVTSQDQLFDSRLLDPGRSWSFAFNTPGTYRYFCVPFPWMKGAVIVLPAEQPSPRPTREPTATPAAPAAADATATPAPGAADATATPAPSPTTAADATSTPPPAATEEPTQRPTREPTATSAPTQTDEPTPTPRPTREPTSTPAPPTNTPQGQR